MRLRTLSACLSHLRKPPDLTGEMLHPRSFPLTLSGDHPIPSFLTFAVLSHLTAALHPGNGHKPDRQNGHRPHRVQFSFYIHCLSFLFIEYPLVLDNFIHVNYVS